jgi:hypothetical protein
MLDHSPTHQMQITAEHEDTEVWTCPTCGRVVLIEWEPLSMSVVTPGDEYAMHTGGKGGLTMGNMEVRQE